jgi:hypothetical protein
MGGRIDWVGEVDEEDATTAGSGTGKRRFDEVGQT